MKIALIALLFLLSFVHPSHAQIRVIPRCWLYLTSFFEGGFRRASFVDSQLAEESAPPSFKYSREIFGMLRRDYLQAVKLPSETTDLETLRSIELLAENSAATKNTLNRAVALIQNWHEPLSGVEPFFERLAGHPSLQDDLFLLVRTLQNPSFRNEGFEGGFERFITSLAAASDDSHRGDEYGPLGALAGAYAMVAAERSDLRRIAKSVFLAVLANRSVDQYTLKNISFSFRAELIVGTAMLSGRIPRIDGAREILHAMKNKMDEIDLQDSLRAMTAENISTAAKLLRIENPISATRSR